MVLAINRKRRLLWLLTNTTKHALSVASSREMIIARFGADKISGVYISLSDVSMA